MGNSRRPIFVSATGRGRSKEFDQAAPETAESLEFRKRRADAFAELKDYSEAIKEYAQVAAAYRGQGQFRKAIEDYGKALDLTPERNPGRLHFDLAGTLSSARRRDEAIAEFKEALKCEPEEWQYWRGMAVLRKPEPGPRPRRPIPRRSS